MSFLGQETITELQDLIKAKDYTIKQIQDRRDTYGQNPDSDWDSDWLVLKGKYDAAKIFAGVAISNAKMTVGVSNDFIPATLQYAAVIKSIRQNPDVQSKGDLQDLSDRLAKASGKGIDFSKMPQPTRGSDVDLNVYNKLGKLPGPKNPKELGIWMVVGGTIAGLLALRFITK